MEHINLSMHSSRSSGCVRIAGVKRKRSQNSKMRWPLWEESAYFLCLVVIFCVNMVSRIPVKQLERGRFRRI
jgi:hypothetical protein